MINKETKEWAPVPRFLNTPQLVKDVNSITDAARGKKFSNFMMAMALLKNYKPFGAPKGLALFRSLQEVRQDLGADQGRGQEVRQDEPGSHLTKTP